MLPLEVADNVDAPMNQRKKAIRELAGLGGGNAGRGVEVFKRVCSACHMIGDVGKKFGPDLSDVGRRFNPEQIITSIIMPNDEISKGFETEMVLTIDGSSHSGFILKETDDVLSLGIADGKQIDIVKEDIEIRKPMKASSMPEGLVKTIAPIEFLDLIEYLKKQKDVSLARSQDGWIRTVDKNPAELRKHGQFTELSRDAEIRFDGEFDNQLWNSNQHLFLHPSKPNGFDFAFHSKHEADHPSLTIRLDAPREVRHVHLLNRIEPQFHARAKGLTIWTSIDGKDFEKVWAAPSEQGEYKIDLPAGTKARYVRVGLDGKGTFHLYQGVVFGH
ncbi:MAG: discoidin domain-containing protein [Pirellulaceae bacterium]